MTTPRLIELTVAVAILGAGVWLYRRRSADGRGYGSQTAVLLLAVAVIMGIHALGGLDYRPSAGELEAAKASAQ